MKPPVAFFASVNAVPGLLPAAMLDNGGAYADLRGMSAPAQMFRPFPIAG